jgi:hypothetical protein
MLSTIAKNKRVTLAVIGVKNNYTSVATISYLLTKVNSKWMNMFRLNKAFYDITEHIPGKIYTNADGWANFPCKGGSVSIWLQE